MGRPRRAKILTTEGQLEAGNQVGATPPPSTTVTAFGAEKVQVGPGPQESPPDKGRCAPEAGVKAPELPTCAAVLDNSPDMRRIGTWVMRNLSLDVNNLIGEPPDPMALTLLFTCQTDPKFKSAFVAKVFDRMMVQDQAATQNKFSDDNHDLKKLISDMSAMQ